MLAQESTGVALQTNYDPEKLLPAVAKCKETCSIHTQDFDP
jgi:hypothetical protein